MPHATEITVTPFARNGDLDMGAEISGADLNNLDGEHSRMIGPGITLIRSQMPPSTSSATPSTTTPSSSSKHNKT